MIDFLPDLARRPEQHLETLKEQATQNLESKINATAISACFH